MRAISLSDVLGVLASAALSRVTEAARDAGAVEVVAHCCAGRVPFDLFERSGFSAVGVDLAAVPGSGPKGRILKEDVQAYVKAMLQKAKDAPAAGAAGGMGIPPIPEVDFSKFGPVEEVPMTRLMQVGAANLHRS